MVILKASPVRLCGAGRIVVKQVLLSEASSQYQQQVLEALLREHMAVTTLTASAEG